MCKVHSVWVSWGIKNICARYSPKDVRYVNVMQSGDGGNRVSVSGGPGPCWWGRLHSGRNCFHGVRFWSWWAAASCQKEVSETVCNQGWRGRPKVVLEAHRSWRDGRLQPITFSVERIICCSLPLSLGVAAVYQMVMEEVRIDSMMAV